MGFFFLWQTAVKKNKKSRQRQGLIRLDGFDSPHLAFVWKFPTGTTKYAAKNTNTKKHKKTQLFRVISEKAITGLGDLPGCERNKRTASSTSALQDKGRKDKKTGEEKKKSHLLDISTPAES